MEKPVDYRYRATVIRVIDGDTIELLIDLGLYNYQRTKIRLAGINTPERGQEGYREAKAFVSDLLEEGEVVVRTHKVGKYGGRWIGTIWVGDICLNHELIKRDLAVPYS